MTVKPWAKAMPTKPVSILWTTAAPPIRIRAKVPINSTINLLSTHDVLIGVSLYDPTGRKVKNLNISKQKQSIILEKGNLAGGMYMLVVQTNNYISKSKLVIRWLFYNYFLFYSSIWKMIE